MSKCPYLFYDNEANIKYWCISNNHPKLDKDRKQAYLGKDKEDIPAFCYNNFEKCPFYKKKTSINSSIAVIKNKNQLPKRRIF